MKIVLTIVLQFLQILSFCQIDPVTTQIYDSNKFVRHFISEKNIIDKAKLMTLNRYGIISLDSTINMLIKQDFRVHKYDSNYRYLTLLIYNNQEYAVDYTPITFSRLRFENRNCEFVIVFSYIDERFYRIKGFDVCDFVELVHDVEKNLDIIELIFYSDRNDERPLIDIDCYYDKYILKKRKYKKIDCDCKCSDRYSNNDIEWF